MKDKQDQRKTIIKATFILIGILLLINILAEYNRRDAKLVASSITYDQLVADIKNDKIAAITFSEPTAATRVLKVTPKQGDNFTLVAPVEDTLVPTIIENEVKLIQEPVEKPGFFSQFFFTWGPVLFLVLMMFYFFKKSSGGNKGLFSINKSKAKLVDPANIKETFADVVGCDEAKLEIRELVDFLKNPEKFSKLGGTIPRGVLFSGPSGTGKTLLAKALAKESGVPFYSISGSDFVEMFVGVGASRVRDMFETAKKIAPCVLFIDEIDAIGGKRGSGAFGGGGQDEREQTLNQMLVELDGMDGNKGIILVAATNRPEVLDQALLRPGRIDRQIVVALPDVNGREEMLKVHSKNVPLVADTDLRKIARGTPGFSGAELKNLVNEAAIFAARRGKKFVDQKDLEDAKDKLMLGVERPSLAMSEQDKKETAYHESGHAIIAKLLKGSDPIYKVTIISRGRALGVTVQLPEKDRFSYKKEYLEDRIAILMGGRAAEEIFCNTFTSGASNDIAVATSTARSMIMRLGMSKLGPVAFGETQSGWGGEQMSTAHLSQKTLETVDNEVNTLINEKYMLAHKLLSENKDKVEAMTAALIEVETLDDWQVENIMQGRHFNDNAGLVEFKAQQNEKDKLDKITKEARDKALNNSDKDVQEPSFIPDVVAKA